MGDDALGTIAKQYTNTDIVQLHDPSIGSNAFQTIRHINHPRISVTFPIMPVRAFTMPTSQLHHCCMAKLANAASTSTQSALAEIIRSASDFVAVLRGPLFVDRTVAALTVTVCG